MAQHFYTFIFDSFSLASSFISLCVFCPMHFYVQFWCIHLKLLLLDFDYNFAFKLADGSTKMKMNMQKKHSCPYKCYFVCMFSRCAQFTAMPLSCTKRELEWALVDFFLSISIDLRFCQVHRLWVDENKYKIDDRKLMLHKLFGIFACTQHIYIYIRIPAGERKNCASWFLMV